MGISKDKKKNIKLTEELMLSSDYIERKDPSWLGNGGKGGIIDYELLKGATLDELVERSGRTISSVRAHIQHLKNVQGLAVSNKKGVYQFNLFPESEISNKPMLDMVLFPRYFEEYISYCNRSQWLKYREAYKFKFGRWLSSRVDFNNMDDETILKVCIDSQVQEYDLGEKGVNFIKSGLQYHDDFITLNDIKVLRKLHEGEVLEKNDLKGSPLSFPKFSVWAGTLIPDRFKIYANEELTKGIAYLFALEDYPRSGIKAFNLANNALNTLALDIKTKYTSEIKELISLIFPENNSFEHSDLSWLTQDFILYLNRMVLDKEVNYFWVNQGGQYKEELKYSCIAATTNNLHHHKRLKGMMEGDVIINYANSAIRATSVVTQEFEIKPRPYLPEGDDDLIVGVKYSELEEPISIHDLKKLFEDKRDILPKRYGPFDKYLGVVQSYCLDFNEESYKLIFDNKSTSDNLVEEPQKILYMNKFPLNQILYGPPGTGKTYNTIVKAAEIIENRAIDDFLEAKEIFNKHLGDRIEFITFHQNYSYEDFIQGLRPDVDNDTSLTFDRKDGIFKMISDRALENLTLSKKAPEEVSKDVLFDNALEDFIEKVQDSEDGFHIDDSVAYITEVLDNSFRYKGPNWGHSSLMKFKDLKELNRNDVQSRKDIKKLTSISGLANQHASYFLRVYNEIVKLLPEQEVVDTSTKVERNNYVIIIDEINRANISRVFGELITLIEPDKRSHGAIPLKATLPSGEEFIVPSNLYIIGTMNTADKSIALLDIALRRRFEFVAMYPKYTITGHEIYDVDILEKINKKIIEKKGHDFQIGHSYFMGDNKDLLNRMNVKVIPLLLEYFMNDEKEVKEILNHANLEIESDSWPIRIIRKRD